MLKQAYITPTERKAAGLAAAGITMPGAFFGYRKLNRLGDVVQDLAFDGFSAEKPQEQAILQTESAFSAPETASEPEKQPESPKMLGVQPEKVTEMTSKEPKEVPLPPPVLNKDLEEYRKTMIDGDAARFYPQSLAPEPEEPVLISALARFFKGDALAEHFLPNHNLLKSY